MLSWLAESHLHRLKKALRVNRERSFDLKWVRCVNTCPTWTILHCVAMVRPTETTSKNAADTESILARVQSRMPHPMVGFLDVNLAAGHPTAFMGVAIVVAACRLDVVVPH